MADAILLHIDYNYIIYQVAFFGLFLLDGYPGYLDFYFEMFLLIRLIILTLCMITHLCYSTLSSLNYDGLV